MRKSLILGSLCAVLASPLAANLTTAYAATNTAPSMYATKIVLGTKLSSTQEAFAHDGTTYMPIWYVMQALGATGIHGLWKPPVWNLTVPSSLSINDTNLPKMNGKFAIELNGKPVIDAPTLVADDPYTHKPTTYMPIWYVMQTLNRLGIQSTWVKSVWTLTMPKPLPTVPSGDVSLAAMEIGVAKALGGKMPMPVAQDYGTPATVQMVDSLYWSDLGISDASYQPGSSVFDWGTKIELNPTGASAGDLLTPASFAVMLQNLKNLTQGYVSFGNGNYQIEYPPADEALATFAGDSVNGQPIYTNNADVKAAIEEVYQFYQGIHATVGGASVTLTMPSLASTNFFAYMTAGESLSYSTDGGQTWQSAAALDTRNVPSGTGSVEVKVDGLTGLNISINQYMPSFSGTLALGELSVSAPNSTTLSVIRWNINS